MAKKKANKKKYDWPEEHDRLWDLYVPKRGQADTLQGELIRIVGKLIDQAYRNGNCNWGSDHEKMWCFVGKHIASDPCFSKVQQQEITASIEEIIRDHKNPDVSGHGSCYYLVNERVVDWCMSHPDPIPHKQDPKLNQ